MSRYAEALLALGHEAELAAEQAEEFWQYDLGIDPRFDPERDEQDRDPEPEPLAAAGAGSAHCPVLRAGGGGGEVLMTLVGRPTCPRCVGIGLVRDPRPRVVDGALRYLTDCPDCRGLGHAIHDSTTTPSVNSGTTPPPEETP